MAALLLIASEAFAQYEPTSTWPYVYKEFTEGELQMTVGRPKKAQFNIHVGKGRLHFIDGSYICEASSADVYSVRIGTDYYVNARGVMMKVLAKSVKSVIGEEAVVDHVRLNATGGAYGSSSSTLSTTALSAIEQTMAGGRTELTRLVSSREDGQVLPLVRKKYIVINGDVIFASKKDVLEAFPDLKDEITSYLKKSKTKWNDANSLLRLSDHILEILN